MPFFRPPSPQKSQETASARSRSMFSRRSGSPEHDHTSTNGPTRTNSTRPGSRFFNRHHSSSADSLHLKKDPTIVAARQKVADAESAESGADRALDQARAAVRRAREHVKILEQEVLAEARHARAKEAEAKTVSKSARGLGRHG
ncbi:hypothetical protein A0H81_09356 [Grifola frondosa]|uniref:Uncharacterized protein n=1 Tax=Grifola frondosa TaxID=5627 RepID=A0A1C7M2M5_GRIFR|nr:hypothetical protein A0H81_09356 [Grifola frondosa]